MKHSSPIYHPDGIDSISTALGTNVNVLEQLWTQCLPLSPEPDSVLAIS